MSDQVEEIEEVEPVGIHGEKVFGWRFSVFIQLGFGPAEAEALANTREDTHHVRKMIQRGCSIEQAIAILL